MGSCDNRRLGRLPGMLLAAVLALGAGASAVAQPAAADNQQAARDLLKQMADYLNAHKNISAQYDLSLEVITPDIEKLTFNASGDVEISRPDRLHARRTGGYNDVEFSFDGKTATIYDRVHNVYSTLPASGTIESLVDRMRTEFNVEMPAMALLRPDSYAQLMDGVVDAKDIGPGVINGEECEHLAFRNADVDWQLWVRKSATPTPCMYIITSKTVAAGPQYRMRLYNVHVDDGAPSPSLAFAAPAGAKLVPFDQLSNLGELPPPAPFGGKQ